MVKNDVRELIKEQIRVIGQTLFGMEEVTKIFCLSKATDLTVMLLGPHATAKSSLARVWSMTTGLNYRVVTSSEVDESLIAYIDPAIFREKNIVKMRRGELMETDHIIVDEFFLWLNKYRAKLHQLLEERTYAGLDVLTKTYTFLSNPLSEFYAGQIEEKNLATIDRIDLFVPVNQPKVVPSEKMLRKFSQFGRQEKDLNQVATWDNYLAAREQIKEIEVPSRIVVWLTLFSEELASCKKTPDKFSLSQASMRKLCLGCNENAHPCAMVALSKPRFLRATLLLAKSLAWLDEKTEVDFRHLEEAIEYTLPHRLVWLSKDATFRESLESVGSLVQDFNSHMLAWKNRGIFSKLKKILEAGKEQEPVYLGQEARDLVADISEIHVIRNFVTESLDSAQESIVAYYLGEGKKKTFASKEELEGYLAKSGLSPYQREDLAFTIEPEPFFLEISLEPGSKGPKEILEGLGKVITVTSTQRLEDLITNSVTPRMRELDGHLQILFKDAKQKKTFLEAYQK